jgi:biotin synthase-related radical SAM superfamily protein
VLVTITNDGLNPYKALEMFTKYRLNIPVQFQLDELDAEPSAEVWAKVKKEKIDRSEFHAQLKADKYVNDKERIESLTVYDGKGKA